MQERAAHLMIGGDRREHLRVQLQQLQNGIQFSDEYPPEPAYLRVVPSAGSANFCAGLRAKRNGRHS